LLEISPERTGVEDLENVLALRDGNLSKPFAVFCFG
jgi:hypothetical protein